MTFPCRAPTRTSRRLTTTSTAWVASLTLRSVPALRKPVQLPRRLLRPVVRSKRLTRGSDAVGSRSHLNVGGKVSLAALVTKWAQHYRVLTPTRVLA